jgi:protein-disulfide isomerase
MSKQSREQGRTERAAAIRAAQARKERNRRLVVILGIVVLLGAIVAAGAWYGGGGTGKDTATAESGAPVKAGPASLRLGDPDAPVKVVIYEDFLCPFCRELETSTRDFLAENADKGKVYVEYQPINILRDFPYSAKAMNAWAAVLKHASPAAALKLHTILYDNQPYEQSSNDVTDAQIAAWVKEAGGDNADVCAAMKSQDTDFFAKAEEAMTTAKITGTPSVFINGQELPVTAVADMVSKLEAAVDQGS